VKEKLAENLHELWAMNKIDNGWIWGEVSLNCGEVMRGFGGTDSL